MNACDRIESDGAIRQCGARSAWSRGLPSRLARTFPTIARLPCRLCDNLPMTNDATAPGAASPMLPDAEPGSDLAPLTRRIVDLLESRGVAHRLLRHQAALTSEEASRVRGTPLEAGAKALVC